MQNYNFDIYEVNIELEKVHFKFWNIDFKSKY